MLKYFRTSECNDQDCSGGGHGARAGSNRGAREFVYLHALPVQPSQPGIHSQGTANQIQLPLVDSHRQPCTGKCLVFIIYKTIKKIKKSKVKEKS